MSRADYLVVAVSGRALAQSARRDGLAVHVIDLFGDTDTRDAAVGVTVVPAGGPGGFAPSPLIETVAALPADLPLVPGSGFEEAPALLGRLTATRPCLGNPAAVIERLQHPQSFFALLAQFGIPHPPVLTHGTVPDGNWLLKRIGGRGGGHIRPARRRERIPAGHYLQRRVAGKSLSAVILADGRTARVLGWTRHWRAQPAAGNRYRHSGMVALPAVPPAPWHRQVAECAAAVVGASGAVGLCGLDFLLCPETHSVQVLEFNPRPPASFELHEADASLFRLHVEACRGSLNATTPVTARLRRAAAVLYAPARCRIPAAWRWPDWTADRPAAGVDVEADAPICTVFGGGEAPAVACRQVRGRLRRLAAALDVLP